MKDEGSQQEDVAGLFRKFGGDVAGYKEFAPAETPAAAPVSGGWALVNGGRPAAPEPAVAAPAAAPVAEAPLFAAPSATAPVAPTVAVAAPPAAVAPQASPSMSHSPAAEHPSADAEAPRELDALFARLAGHPPSPASPGQGLMARWRRPA